MKVLLINVQGCVGFFSRKHSQITMSPPLTPPMGLLYIARSLEELGHSVQVIEYFMEQHPKDKIKKSLISTDVVGLSISTSWYQDAAHVAHTIHDHDSSIPIILGGPHCIFHPKQSLLDIPTADISIEGEGEHVIKDVARALEGKQLLSRVPGVYYKHRKDEIRHGPPAQLIHDLDALPFPARHLVDQYDFGKIHKTYLYKPKVTSIVTSRGCSFRCRFCARHADSYKTYRQRSAANVIKEIKALQGRYKSLYFVDENFVTDKKRVNQIMDMLINEGSNLDLLIYGLRVDSADKELFKKMKKAGVKYVEFGIESGNQDVLDFYQKQITLDQIRNAVALSREMNFVTTGHFTLGAPIETLQHIEHTIDFACSLPLDIAVFLPLYYMYGSDLWNDAVRKGLITQDDGYGVVTDSQRGLGQLTHEELETYCKEAVKRFYYRPRYLAQQLIRSVKRLDFHVIRTGLST